MARLIAFYLPQYHPIPENDRWWGTGFTEWTNTGKARPLFPGHYQPHVPADLGYYDLRVPETRVAQAVMARDTGIEAFCYYHYWFAGKRILERPLNEVVRSGEPDYPFCLCWANQTWTGIWHGSPNKILIEQTYPGEADYRAHFRELLPLFRDNRYLKVDGKPLFVVYRPGDIPDPLGFTRFWQQLARESGLPGLHLVATIHGRRTWDFRRHGFDAAVMQYLPPLRSAGYVSWRSPFRKLRHLYQERTGKPTVYRYGDVMLDMLPDAGGDAALYPCLIPNWDNTPRSGKNGLVLHDSSPELFRIQLRRALDLTARVPDDQAVVFIKSWNEWAEGNYLEPDLRFGKAYLDVIREEIYS
ncbi:glycosyltransferase WbsX family protein [Trichlorobacter ammonificans]|uniref:Glycosyltransferase WbsX n=1 Tax=Trichlorobacter ammonificans TaxID=2916410 RepID=A0ABM9D808_9BACT|nr:glycoside hydrolase family 99-like domain-containing protein [Trichlorobacter ammonificans]CAH2031345.1 Glycosyltransferase WbsX [Trichlorobacter ammonificans]